MNIDMNKKYRTRNGLPVRILCIVGFIVSPHGELLYNWLPNGMTYLHGKPVDTDLIEVKDEEGEGL
jgi:hypothetical protein